MTLTAELVRELAARGESPTLDYKRDDYDWSAKPANAELAKDLMAMANLLGPSAQPAHILIGVTNVGDLVGIQSKHMDDAQLHQKVRDLLNCIPAFSYQAVDVDGLSVGVYTIVPPSSRCAQPRRH